jgi:ribosomal protein S18 acetylase RimI-like enzyme
MKISIEKCVESDLLALSSISYETYKDTFLNQNSPVNMYQYLNNAFGIKKIHSELLNKDSCFYFIYHDKNLAGYFKINESPAQTDIHDNLSLELERIYLKKEFQGKGLGKIMLNYAIDIASNKNKGYIWLSVWEKNIHAIQFYKNNGFSQFAVHPFIMGNEEQTDLLMKKNLK